MFLFTFFFFFNLTWVTILKCWKCWRYRGNLEISRTHITWMDADRYNKNIYIVWTRSVFVLILLQMRVSEQSKLYFTRIVCIFHVCCVIALPFCLWINNSFFSVSKRLFYHEQDTLTSSYFTFTKYTKRNIINKKIVKKMLSVNGRYNGLTVTFQKQKSNRINYNYLNVLIKMLPTIF